MLALDLLQSDQVPAIARSALEQGLDHKVLAILAAGVTKGSDVRPAFGDVLREMRVTLPSRVEAGRLLVRLIADDIATGKVDTFEGARQIGTIARAVGEDFHEFDPFIYVESEAEDRPADREFFARAIVDEARRLLS